eukprot:gnl/Dysnectes_brevis/3766_a4840_684.p1 GENE.gnl/Dysnectes_brevis/3766_a4840_684~~gnl/Dysnectes_brevis/3766_a4840_684.p1  ORF type:complete len:544 (+),score=192.30 gnl/Dysnectes_brevis/3766_a4840_684:42-1673(+)
MPPKSKRQPVSITLSAAISAAVEKKDAQEISSILTSIFPVKQTKRQSKRRQSKKAAQAKVPQYNTTSSMSKRMLTTLSTCTDPAIQHSFLSWLASFLSDLHRDNRNLSTPPLDAISPVSVSTPPSPESNAQQQWLRVAGYLTHVPEIRTHYMPTLSAVVEAGGLSKANREQAVIVIHNLAFVPRSSNTVLSVPALKLLIQQLDSCTNQPGTSASANRCCRIVEYYFSTPKDPKRRKPKVPKHILEALPAYVTALNKALPSLPAFLKKRGTAALSLYPVPPPQLTAASLPRMGTLQVADALQDTQDKGKLREMVKLVAKAAGTRPELWAPLLQVLSDTGVDAPKGTMKAVLQAQKAGTLSPSARLEFLILQSTQPLAALLPLLPVLQAALEGTPEEAKWACRLVARLCVDKHADALRATPGLEESLVAYGGDQAMQCLAFLRLPLLPDAVEHLERLPALLEGCDATLLLGKGLPPLLAAQPSPLDEGAACLWIEGLRTTCEGCGAFSGMAEGVLAFLLCPRRSGPTAWISSPGLGCTTSSTLCL